MSIFLSVSLNRFYKLYASVNTCFVFFTTAMYRGRFLTYFKFSSLVTLIVLYSGSVVVISLLNVASIVLCFSCPSFATHYLVSFLVLQLDY